MGGGLIFHRLKFAHVGGIAVICTTAWGLRARGGSRLLLLGTAIVGFTSVLLFPYARAASAAMAGGLIVSVALALPKRRLGFAFGATVGVAAMAVVLFVAPLRARFISALTASGSGDRDLLLASGVAAVRAHPWVGVGYGRFRPSLFAPPGSPEHVLEQPGKAHNEFLSMAAEIGVPGALAFVWLLIWLARTFKPRTTEGAAAEGVLAYFALLSQVHDPLFQAPFSMALVLAVSMGLRRRSGPAQSETPSNRETARSTQATPTATLCAAPMIRRASERSERRPARSAPST
jgi:O-antigen ligase